MAKTFEPNFESLRQYTCPEWFRDAKFGIWSHWGPQSVPMYGDWYARNMYIEGTPQYIYHLRHYGHPSEFGYKDLVKLWHAENFDPDGLMELYHKAGARYFMSQATHHDHFFNYASKLNRFNSVDVGPHKDICGLWQKAAKKYNMPFGMSEHLGASFSWWAVNKGADKEGPYAGVPYDGNDPEYRDFYHDNYEHFEKNREMQSLDWWYTPNKAYQAYWLAAVKEMIDLYHPDLLYSDGGLPFGVNRKSEEDDPLYNVGLEFLSYYYNTAQKFNGEDAVVYLQKDRRPAFYKIGTLDIEKSQLTDIAAEPWHTDTCIGNWFYDVRQVYKTPAHVVEMLVDIVSKNGNMLLNILQKPDGSIDAQARFILEKLAAWFAVNGEGIYGTRPWRVAAEGASRVNPEGFKESKVEWLPGDYRFTAKGNVVYAFMMAPEQGEAVLRSFTERVQAVELLGFGKCDFAQPFGVLNVRLPEKLPCEFVNCLKITL
ncbi:MAG: alpha-L-fucosidase [Oscillospiraceae bacterium]|nr:alpha-L-fucosidase [Oscillospiraceae bacterium]